MGPSGSGKTTLLKILGGRLQENVRGTVTLRSLLEAVGIPLCRDSFRNRMAERRWQVVIWIRCFTRRHFSSSRKNCMGVALGGTSQIIVPRNSTVLREAMVVDPAESIQRFKPDYRKWAIRFCISMRSSTEPTIPSSKSSAYRA
ncbi:hypothetical protein T459_30675 [Capsicum annuum]|uniref:ABC transporter domain-containing protein n=1 Tax=Capsicum annuum TaxID=4072 RepID=A0A2G2Y936_CAPAN|nr:hypothetical protein FXO37_00898 [Capsicum annuum]PHT66250.1 hypothetical protein T459_30675 [Capsicum annuum]